MGDVTHKAVSGSLVSGTKLYRPYILFFASTLILAALAAYMLLPFGDILHVTHTAVNISANAPDDCLMSAARNIPGLTLTETHLGATTRYTFVSLPTTSSLPTVISLTRAPKDSVMIAVTDPLKGSAMTSADKNAVVRQLSARIRQSCG
jgi:hypothetical protein